MADIETSHAGNETKPVGVGARWVASVVLIVALTGVTAATMRWQQPIRAFLDGYFEGDGAQDTTFDPQVVIQGEQEVTEAAEFDHHDLREEPESGTQDAVDSPVVLDIQDADVPISISGRYPLSGPSRTDDIRSELRSALAPLDSEVELFYVTEALHRALAIANTNAMSQKVIALIEQALTETDYVENLNIASILGRIDDISKLVVSLVSEGSTNRPDIESDSTFAIAEPPESQGFWRELTDGVTGVYRVRRIGEPVSPGTNFDLDEGTLLRLLVLLERARSDIRILSFDSYRASLHEALTIVDSLNQEDTSEWHSVRNELLELVNLELTSPRQTIRTALAALTDETLTPSDDAVVPEL